MARVLLPAAAAVTSVVTATAMVQGVPDSLEAAVLIQTIAVAAAFLETATRLHHQTIVTIVVAAAALSVTVAAAVQVLQVLAAVVQQVPQAGVINCCFHFQFSKL